MNRTSDMLNWLKRDFNAAVAMTVKTVMNIVIVSSGSMSNST